MAPDFEIFHEIEIMRMISLFLPDLRLSAVGTPELRLAEPEGWGMTLAPKSRTCIAPELRIATPRSWLRSNFEDYTQTTLARMKLGWRKPKPGYPT